MTAWPIDAPTRLALSSRQRQRVTEVDILSNGDVTVAGVKVTDGQVTISSGATRRQGQFTAVDNTGALIPGIPTDALAPYGNEAQLYRGVVVPGVGPVRIPLARLRIEQAASAWAGGAVKVQVSGTDRSAVVASDKFTDYDSIYQGAPANYALNQLLGPALPSNQIYNWADVSGIMVNAQTYAPGDDRWALAQDLAAELGCLLYFDQVGTSQLQPIPDPSTQSPAWRFAQGEATALSGVTNSLDRTGAANIIVAVAQGSNVAAPLLAISEDTDPTSPTYVGGPFGANVVVLTSSTLTTHYDLQVYADSYRRLYFGATQQAQAVAGVIPILDAYDVVEIASEKVKMDGRYVLDQLSIPLGSGTMSMTTRGVVL